MMYGFAPLRGRDCRMTETGLPRNELIDSPLSDLESAWNDDDTFEWYTKGDKEGKETSNGFNPHHLN